MVYAYCYFYWYYGMILVARFVVRYVMISCFT